MAAESQSAAAVGGGGGGGGEGRGGAVVAAAAGGGRRMTASLLLHHPDDPLFLNDLFCFVRRQVEAFVVAPPGVGGNSSLVIAAGDPAAGMHPAGAVGLRCAHCFSSEWDTQQACQGQAGGENRKRLRSAVSFPKATRLVYQSVRNWQRRHLPKCGAVSESVKAEYARLQAGSGRSVDARQYWEECCRRMGMIDSDDGIRLRDGRMYFEEGGYYGGEGGGGLGEGLGSSGGAGGFGGSSGGRGASMGAGAASMSSIRKSLFAAANAGRSQGHGPNSALNGPTFAVAAGRGAAALEMEMEAARLNLNLNHRPREVLERRETAPAAAVAGGRPAAHPPASADFAAAVAVGTAPASSAAAAALRANAASRLDAGNLVASDVSVVAAAQELRSSAPAVAASESSTHSARGGAAERYQDLDSALVTACLNSSGRLSYSHSASPSLPPPPVANPLRQVQVQVESNPSKSSLITEGSAGAPSKEYISAARHLLEPTPIPTSHSPASDAAAVVDQLPPGVSPSPPDEDGAPGRGADSPLSDSCLMNSLDALLKSSDDALSSVGSGNLSRPFSSSSPPSSDNEAVLELVRLALSSVRAAGQIRRLSPGPLGTGTASEGGGGSSSTLQSEDPSPEDELAELGAHLHELFSGRNAHDSDNDDDHHDDDDEGGEGARGIVASSSPRAAPFGDGPSRRRRRKKGKRSGDALGYTPLSELGLPPALCGLVLGMVSPYPNSQYGAYGSVAEVEDDLRLLASEPDKFLFRDGGSAAAAACRIDPGRIYGREEETARLLFAYKRATDPARVRATKEVVLVSGYSGTGKSALVYDLRDRFVSGDGGATFVSGKFDSMRQIRPLSAVVSAVDEYCGILAADERRIGTVRAAVREAMGAEGTAVLARLVPNLVRIAGPVKDGAIPTKVDGREALQRLLFTFRALFRATCSRSCPVVLFLDDLQFADETSLLLVRAIMSDRAIDGLLLIGCYRVNEVGPDHPLTRCVSDVRRLPHVAVTTLEVGQLGVDDVNSLLSDTARLTPRMTRPLAEEILRKTGGNALFVVQFLVSLQDEGLFHYSLASRSWEWDIHGIRDRVIADGVVELLTAKFLKLGREVGGALRVAAAFGAQFREELFLIIDRDPERTESTRIALDIAVAEGILSKAGSTYKFAHDQIQRAAYLLIPELEREAFHLMTGRLLWKWCTEEETEAHLFVVVDQLHRGAGLITAAEEKAMLARLSLVAGEMATALSAFLPASAYLKAGLSLLNEDDWHCNRELCFDLYNMCVETENILGDFKSMHNHLETILAKAKTLEEKLRSYYTLVQALGTQGKTIGAIKTAIAVINELGEILPANVTEIIVKKEMGMTMHMLLSQGEESLLQLKTMKPGTEETAMKFLHALLYHVYMEWRPYYPIPVCRMIRLSVSHGVCRESALAFASYGAVQAGVLGNYDGAYSYAKLALAIIERFQAKEQMAKVYGAVYGVINHFKEPIQSALPPLKQAIEAGLATGDIEHAFVAAHIHMAISWGSGVNLEALWEEMKASSQLMLSYNSYRGHMYSRGIRQAVLNLLGRSADPTKMEGEAMKEGVSLMAEDADESGRFASFNNYIRMWLQVIHGEFRDAWDTRTAHIKGNEKTMSMVIPCWCYNTWYSGIIAAALARTDGEGPYLDVIEQSTALMTAWAKSSRWNFQNKLELMKAEYAYLRGDFAAAERCYNLSIELAASHRFVHEQALALERCAIYHLEVGSHAEAKHLFMRARDCYSQWGARSKVAHIEEKYL